MKNQHNNGKTGCMILYSNSLLTTRVIKIQCTNTCTLYSNRICSCIPQKLFTFSIPVYTDIFVHFRCDYWKHPNIIMATSVPSEMDFFTPGDILTDHRVSLNPECVDRLFLLKKNMNYARSSLMLCIILYGVSFHQCKCNWQNSHAYILALVQNTSIRHKKTEVKLIL